MIKRFLSILGLLYCLSCLQAQAQISYGAPSGTGINGKFADQLFISDVNGMPVSNKYADITGSAFFDPVYRSATLTMASGKVFAQIPARIDLVTQDIYFMSTNGMEAYIRPGLIRRIAYNDTTAKGIVSYVFKSGMPPIEYLTADNFYQILAEGRCSFLKAITKKIQERKSEMSGEVSKEIETTENYFLLKEGSIKRVKRDKDFFLAEMSDRKDDVSNFINTKRINFKNNDQVAQLVMYYNTP